MKVLIVHHLEPMWETSYKKYGESFYSLAQKFVRHLEKNKYDKVVLTMFESITPFDEHYEAGLDCYVDKYQDYAYGWEPDMFEKGNRGIDYCPGGNHSWVVYLPNWMKHLKGDNVFISGAFDGECIEDLEIALDFLSVDFNRVEELIL